MLNEAIPRGSSEPHALTAQHSAGSSHGGGDWAVGSAVEYSQQFDLQPMTCRVTSMVAGKVFYVECLARNYTEARQVALAQHPNARIIGVTAVFR